MKYVYESELSRTQYPSKETIKEGYPYDDIGGTCFVEKKDATKEHGGYKTAYISLKEMEEIITKGLKEEEEER